MAPEVARGHGSLLISDVYSFGVLLWEICTLDKPYKHINSRDEFMDSVVVEEWRHTTSKIPSVTLRKLIKICWQADARYRPQFSQIVKKLRVEVAMTKTQNGNAPAVPNKGFGSSVNLKRTASWTAKKFTSGISQSTLGVVRMGFRSKESFSNAEDAASASTDLTQSSQSRTGRVGRRSSGGRSKSPRNPLAEGVSSSSGRLGNASFGGPTMGRRKIASKSSLLLGDLRKDTMIGIPEQGQHILHHEPDGDDDHTTPDTPKPLSLRRGLPSAPVIGN